MVYPYSSGLRPGLGVSVGSQLVSLLVRNPSALCSDFSLTDTVYTHVVSIFMSDYSDCQ